MDLADSKGKTLFTDQNTPGGYTLEGHSTNATSLSKISQQGWDFVILQEQSQKPSFPPSQVASDVYPFAQVLVDSIRSANECAEPLFFMTWGRENGDQSNCEFYEPLCTYEGMQQRLTESYTEMALINQAQVSPVGEAWRRVRANYPNIDLYNNDGSHPNIFGSYLAACVFYNMLFNDTSIGAQYPSNITDSDALILQQIADETVNDDNYTWNYSLNNLNAYISAQIEGPNVQFTSISENATFHFWDFGNGQTSAEENPLQIYELSDEYMVTYIVGNNCNSDTINLNIEVITSSVENELKDLQIDILSNPFTDLLIINIDYPERLELSVVNLDGKIIHSEELSDGLRINTNKWSSGNYFLYIRSEMGFKVVQVTKI